MPIVASLGYAPWSRLQQSTVFPLVQNPLTGLWQPQNDPNLTSCQVIDVGGIHVACGTQVPQTGVFDDSSATLSGFARSHKISGVVYRNVSIPSTPNFEVELHAAWWDQNPPYNPGGGFGNTTVTGYEVNVSHLGKYANIGRFKGAALVSIGNNTTGSIGFTPAMGDVFDISCVQNSDGTCDIGAFWTPIATGIRASMMTYHDTTPPRAGSPGIGFFIEPGATNGQFGFTSIAAADLP